MKRNLIAALIGSLLLAATAAFAADHEFAKLEWTGSAGIGGQVVDTKDTVDEGKLREYRDMRSGPLSLFDLRGRSSTYYIDLFTENLGRKDFYFDLKGGSYGKFKYRLFSDNLEHFFTTDARTPYSGAGTTTQRAQFPNLNPSTWNTYDLAYKRRNDGGMFEMSFGSPWYLRADVGSIGFEGNKLQAYPQGTSSGQGFVDLAVPVDYETTNYSVEAGYSTRRLHVALAFLDSKFTNDNEVVTWTNGYFGNNNPPATAANLGIDASYLSPDNKMTRLSLNGVVRQLFWNSSLGLRYTSSDWTSDTTLATSQLIGSATLKATTPFLASPSKFDGDVQYDTWSATWSASPAKWLDLRLYANELKRENHSSHLLFSGFTTDTNSLGCVGVVGGTGPVGSATGPRVCVNEPFSYDRSSFGTELAFRPNRTNRISVGYDETDTDREFHPDSDSTDEKRTSLEWRNTTLETLVVSLKFQQIERRSNFLAAALPNTVWSYDVANMDRDVYKLGLDYTPSATVDLTAEYYFKKSDYTNSPAGRQADDRGEIYLGATFGKSDGFRFKLYVDTEKATTDARLVSRNNTTGAINYTVFTGIEDTFEAAGLGFDWPASKRLMFVGAASWNKSKGVVDFNGLAGAAALPTTLVNIPNYGNNDKLALNFKGTYDMNERWDLTAGLAYEDVSFDDIQYNPYSYILPTTPLTTATQGTAAYLSGWYRDPAYKATIGYVMAKFKF
jgi:hypothetical protein